MTLKVNFSNWIDGQNLFFTCSKINKFGDSIFLKPLIKLPSHILFENCQMEYIPMINNDQES